MISVCIATYNGEKYIEKQLESILSNIKAEDEIIISDDGSSDNTLNIINKLKIKNSNIKVIKGPQKGVVLNFQNAINHATGDYIFLSDQDDIWEENKVECVMKYFQQHYTIVVHDASIINGNEKIIETSFFKIRGSGSGILKNFIKNTYIGCCMAFTRELKNYILPIPQNIEMHDWWIGLLGEIYGKPIFIQDKLIKYRRHENNVSQMHHYPIYKMIINRVTLLNQLIKRTRRNVK